MIRVIGIVLMGLLVGCAASPDRDKNVAVKDTVETITADFNRSNLIAQDFTNTLLQIEEVEPSSTALYTQRPQSRFGQMLLGQLQAAGFDLRIGHAGAGTGLSFNINQEELPSELGNPVFTFIVAAGQVKLKRSYEVDVLGVQPTSTMFVLGTNPDAIAINDSLFDRGVLDSHSSPASNPSLPAEPPAFPQPVPVPLQEPIVKSPLIVNHSDKAPSGSPTGYPDQTTYGDNGGFGDSGGFSEVATNAALQASSLNSLNTIQAPAEQLSQSSRGAQFETADPVPASQVALSSTPTQPEIQPERSTGSAHLSLFDEDHNLFETRESQHADQLNGYTTVAKQVLVFGNDSMSMGVRNKEAVKNMLSSFNSETDVYSVIGCSHGRTQIANGNQILANERAKRVQQEFITAGLGPEKVLSEGCWSHLYFDEKMPRRGVVVLHKRRVG